MKIMNELKLKITEDIWKEDLQDKALNTCYINS